MERLIHSDNLKTVWFLPYVRIRRVERDELRPYDLRELSLFNMNTPEEFARVDEWWRQLSVAG